jgi:hypothetical protein
MQAARARVIRPPLILVHATGGFLPRRHHRCRVAGRLGAREGVMQAVLGRANVQA